MAFSGKYYNQPKTGIRPKPFKSFRDRTYAAAVSPESSRIMAELGIGILIIPQKPWDAVAEELDKYRAVFRDVNGKEAPPPISAGWVFSDEDKDRAAEMAVKYIGGYWESVLEHYQFAGDHLKTMKGYEYYGKFAETIQKYGPDSATEFFMNLQVWGTPEMCYERIVDISDRPVPMDLSAFSGTPACLAMKPNETCGCLRKKWHPASKICRTPRPGKPLNNFEVRRPTTQESYRQCNRRWPTAIEAARIRYICARGPSMTTAKTGCLSTQRFAGKNADARPDALRLHAHLRRSAPYHLGRNNARCWCRSADTEKAVWRPLRALS